MTVTCLYVIGREGGPVKVGVSSQPSGRLAALQIGCPFRLSLLHSEPIPNRELALRLEADFHAVYAEDRLIGEWFNLDRELAIDGVTTAVEMHRHFNGETA